MPPVNNASLQAMFVTFKGQGDVITLHTADPGTNKATARVAGNTDQVTTWPAGSNGSGTGSTVACPVNAGQTVTHVCLWHSSGQHVATYALPGSGAQFSFAGVLNVTPTLTVLAA